MHRKLWPISSNPCTHQVLLKPEEAPLGSVVEADITSASRWSVMGTVHRVVFCPDLAVGIRARTPLPESPNMGPLTPAKGHDRGARSRAPTPLPATAGSISSGGGRGLNGSLTAFGVLPPVLGAAPGKCDSDSGTDCACAFDGDATPRELSEACTVGGGLMPSSICEASVPELGRSVPIGAAELSGQPREDLAAGVGQDRWLGSESEQPQEERAAWESIGRVNGLSLGTRRLSSLAGLVSVKRVVGLGKVLGGAQLGIGATVQNRVPWVYGPGSMMDHILWAGVLLGMSGVLVAGILALLT